MTTERSNAQAKVIAVSERDLLIGSSEESKPTKATDGSALPVGSLYWERDQERDLIREYIRGDGEWIFHKVYSVAHPTEALLKDQVSLLKQIALGMCLLTDTDLSKEI